ncbi:MAG: 5-formyltetrahydrofolate cyclo-ligase [Rheinheimera sp.]|nr:5-formyltetrahydrofolate cyclo-ligase [Rheinheimera sp.]
MPALNPDVINADKDQQALRQALRGTIRRQVRQARQNLTPLQQQQNAAALTQQIDLIPELAAARHIALYLSNDGELDTAPLLAKLQNMGKTLYLPVLHPFCAGYLLFQRYDANTKMTLNKFGIAEPKPDVSAILLPAQFDIIFMPLVAFDAQGQRLGMGGGFYDRTLASLPQGGQKPLLIGLAHQCQQVDAVPAEAWDVPLPMVLTPDKIWSFR